MRQIYVGTTEYLTVNVTASVTLNTQVVAFSFDRATWYAAAWIGTAGTTRKAQLLLNGANTPAVGTHTVWVRVTDSPEIPVLNAGQVAVI